MNLYSYVANDPVSLTDPFGLDPGNGCGFLGFGCVASFFGQLFSSVVRLAVDMVIYQIGLFFFTVISNAFFFAGLFLGGVPGALVGLVIGVIVGVYVGHVVTHWIGNRLRRVLPPGLRP